MGLSTLARSYLVTSHWHAIECYRMTSISVPRIYPTLKDLSPILKKSVDVPLDIRINDTRPARPFSLAELQNLFKRLFEKISKFRIFIIVLQDWDLFPFVLHAFFAVKKKNLPMILKRFEMHCLDDGSPNPQAEAGHKRTSYLNPIPLFGGATVPSFKHLTLNQVHIDWTNSALTNLTTIDLRRVPLDNSPTLAQFRELFGRSPALRTLSLDGVCPWREFVPEVPVEPILMPSLRCFILRGFKLKYALYVCSLLFTPNVLDLTVMNFREEGDYSKLYDALRSTMPLIRILTLYGINSVPTRQRTNSIVKWLQSMPQVTSPCCDDQAPSSLPLLVSS